MYRSGKGVADIISVVVPHSILSAESGVHQSCHAGVINRLAGEIVKVPAHARVALRVDIDGSLGGAVNGVLDHRVVVPADIDSIEDVGL